VALLKQVPQVKAAMFTSLPPGAWLAPHRDPFAGSLRYHLGLITPNNDDCYILVDGNRHVWHDGEDILFDETFIHEAHNKTQEPRIILFADVNRPMRSRLIDGLNRWISNTLLKASATQNNKSEKVGVLNRSFKRLYSLRTYSKRLKAWNRKVYYGLKHLLFLLLIYFIFLH
jgi:beta-hydroxylase